jgi:hypothetical protein
MTFTIEYQNDTGYTDDGFWEWWEVSDGNRTFKCDAEADAEWLCELLNELIRQREPVPDNQDIESLMIEDAIQNNLPAREHPYSKMWADSLKVSFQSSRGGGAGTIRDLRETAPTVDENGYRVGFTWDAAIDQPPTAQYHTPPDKPKKPA